MITLLGLYDHYLLIILLKQSFSFLNNDSASLIILLCVLEVLHVRGTRLFSFTFDGVPMHGEHWVRQWFIRLHSLEMCAQRVPEEESSFNVLFVAGRGCVKSLPGGRFTVHVLVDHRVGLISPHNVSSHWHVKTLGPPLCNLITITWRESNFNVLRSYVEERIWNCCVNPITRCCNYLLPYWVGYCCIHTFIDSLKIFALLDNFSNKFIVNNLAINIVNIVI